MKTFLFLLLWIPFALAARQHLVGNVGIRAYPGADTVFVSDTETTYLIFPEEVQLVDIGRTGEYFARIEGKSVFLKARSKTSGPTNIFVRFGGAYYTARIAFALVPAQSLYDFSKQPAAGQEPSGGSPVAAVLLEKLAQQEAVMQNRSLRQRARHGLALRLMHLQNDRQLLLLGMCLANNSSIDYRLDFVGFSFQEKRGKLFSRNNSYRKEVRPVAEIVPQRISALEQGSLYYALPLFAMTRRGRLEILIREQEGARLLRIKVPARLINKAPLYADGHGH
ncbi:DUF4138 domain-containing protein [Cesiribacter sp. SM1]|uniref:DUF4138 domain-containing protein n=1 Tax=Cesiribacter sp. SM1 TaxID=2861196 RepID=UPI001CD232EB|nr:DUF4138 domain-containing protein [Cesiribacter sp. SM1]